MKHLLYGLLVLASPLVVQDSCTGCGPGGIHTISADADGDGQTALDGDCDDGDPYTYTGAVERCDGADNDCNAIVDDAGLQTWFHDGDGDTYGLSETAQLQAGCDIPGWVLSNHDCDDANKGINPEAQEVCDGVDQDCNGEPDDGLDNDGDGYSFCREEDCDDQAPDVNPEAFEVCDGLDQDCDTVIDEGVKIPLYLDEDGDGFGNPAAMVEGCEVTADLVDNAGDCDDLDGGAYPGAVEACGLDSAMGDDDCDGIIDEGCATSYFDCSLYLSVNEGDEVETKDVCSVSFRGQEAAYYVPAFIPVMAVYVDQISSAIQNGGYACDSLGGTDAFDANILYDTAQADVPVVYQWQWRNCDGPTEYDVSIFWLPIDYDTYAVQTFWTYMDSSDPDNADSLSMRVTLTNWYPPSVRQATPVGSSSYVPN